MFFSGVNDYQAKAKLPPERVTGVFERKEIHPNLELLHRLAPEGGDIIVVGDESGTYQAIRPETEAELKHHPKVLARFLSSGRIEQIDSSPNEYIFNGPELERAGLALPPEISRQAAILNPLPTFYERNLRVIVWTFYALVLLFVLSLIASLYLVLRKNRQIARSEESLRISEQNYRTVFESTGTAMIIFDEDMIISMANSEAEKLSGHSRNDIEGKMRWTDFVCAEDLPKMQEYHKTRGHGVSAVPQNYDFRIIDKAGNQHNRARGFEYNRQKPP